MKTLGDRAAFPRTGITRDVAQEGMSLRQWLAGQALAGLCASTGLYIVNQIAEAAVLIADATLNELDKEGR